MALSLDGLRARGLLEPPFHLGELLGRAAQKRPDAVWICGRETDSTISYREAYELSVRVAGALIRDGLLSGDRVALLMPNHVAFGAIAWGVWLAGGIISALHPAYAEPLLGAQLDDLQPRTLFTIDQPELLAMATRLVAGRGTRLIVIRSGGPPTAPIAAVAPVVGTFMSFAEWLTDSGPAAPRNVDPEAIALLQFTGGSTGAPKAAALTHRNISVNLGQLVQSLPQLSWGAERFLAVAPFAHTIGFSVNLCGGTYLASTICLEQRFEADSTAQLCLDRGITFINAVPTLLEGLRRSPIARAGSWKSLKCVIAGGAPLPATIRAAFETLTGCDVLQGYGLSETSPAVLLGHPRWGIAPDSAGRPIADTRIAITAADDPERFVPVGEVGEIRIGGPQVMQGYWHKPLETAEALPGGLLRTGDLGKIDADGNVYIVGRLKDLIIASGYNIYPSHVEEAILTHAAVIDAAVIGIPDAYRGESVKAVVVLQAGFDMTLAELQAWLKPRLSPMEMPRLLEIRNSLPKSPAGKTLKNMLREGAN